MPKKPTDYSKLVIYKIQHINNPELLYVGSTTDFTKRKYQHKWYCSNDNAKEYNYKLYQMIRENGNWDMFNMVVIKPFPCQNKRDAEAEEDKVMREMKATLNSIRAFITPEERIEIARQYYTENIDKIAENKKQYYLEHRDEMAERRKKYYLGHKEQIAEQIKQYRLEHRDKILERNKQYRLEHRDKILERNKQNITCECGCIITQCNLPRHKRSLKHQDLLNKHLV